MFKWFLAGIAVVALVLALALAPVPLLAERVDGSPTPTRDPRSATPTRTRAPTDTPTPFPPPLPPADWMYVSMAGNGFGSSVAAAGDVNADGYADVVVGTDSWDRPARPISSTVRPRAWRPRRHGRMRNPTPTPRAFALRVRAT